MAQSFHYAAEKMAAAVYPLGASTGSLQDRLHGAFMSFHTLDEDDFPEGSVREAWPSIEARMTERQAPQGYLEGDAKFTLDQISDVDAHQLATDVIDLCFGIHREWLQT